MTKTVYSVQQLTKVYSKPRVVANDRIDLEVGCGDFIGVFGPNGAGKTTLIRQMMALLRPTEGRIFLFDHDVIREPWAVPHCVGYYGQKSLALRAHKLWEVLYIAGLLRGQSQTEARRQVKDLIEQFQLDGPAQRLLDNLSGGEQRLAALLSTFMGYPPVLVLDEPTNELDPLRRQSVWDYLWHLRDQRGSTIIFVTHNILEAEKVVDRVVIIDRGVIQATGTPGELKRCLVGDSVRLEIRLRDDATQALTEELLLTVPGSVRIRPGRWQIIATKNDSLSLIQTLVGRIGFDAVDDFRLVTPTLEDVYVKLTARRWGRDEDGDG